MKKFKHSQIIGIVALAYALIWGVTLFLHFDIFKPKQYAEELGFLDRWFVLYRLTFQTSFAVILWLILFGVTRFWGQESKLGRFASNNLLMASLVLYLTLMLIYGVVGIAFWGLSISFMDPRTWYMLFTYLGAPIVAWHIFLVNKEKAPSYRGVIYMMIYPVAFFILNMIIGNTVTWFNSSGWPHGRPKADYLCPDCLAGSVSHGWPAYSYFFLDPSVYPSTTVFILTMLGAFCVLLSVSYLLIRVKRKQLMATTNFDNDRI